MKQIISGHNAKILTNNETQIEDIKLCNCRSKKDCPLEGKCLETSVIYQATVTETSSMKTETYVGLTADPFKNRYNNHTKSFNHIQYKTDTELSNHIWMLKNKNIEYKIKWKIIDRGKPFNQVSRICQLCTIEKYYILLKPEVCSLNSNNELGSYCRHQKKLLHCNLKIWSTRLLICAFNLYFDVWPSQSKTTEDCSSLHETLCMSQT